MRWPAVLAAVLMAAAGCTAEVDQPAAAPAETPAGPSPDPPDPAGTDPGPAPPEEPSPAPTEPTGPEPTAPAEDRDNGTVAGQVLDGERGVPAHVASGGWNTTADDEGRFRVALPPGQHTFVATFDGRSVEATASVVADASVPLVMALPSPSPLANTHYLFLMNLNDVKCSTDLGHGDILIASRLIDHATGLGMPQENVWFYNEDGGALCRDDDPAHFDRLPAAYQNGSVFAGPATLVDFAGGLHAAASLAIAGEAAGGPPARIFVMHSSHGLLNPINAFGTGPFGERVFSSLMALQEGSVTDVQFGDALNAAIDGREHGGVDVEVAVLVDCSFCGGFADSPLPYPGTTTTSVDTAGVVGANRVVEVGCAWVTECFGNPAVTYDHIFNECMFTMRADGYGPLVDGTGVPHPLPGGDDDLGRDVIVADPGHHGPDGAVTLEEAYWCALDSVQMPIDVIGIQQMFQLVDQMDADLVDDGFLLWAPDGVPTP